MSDQPEPTPWTPGMALREVAKRQAEERDRLISYLAACGIHKLEQYLKEMTR